MIDQFEQLSPTERVALLALAVGSVSLRRSQSPEDKSFRFPGSSGPLPLRMTVERLAQVPKPTELRAEMVDEAVFLELKFIQEPEIVAQLERRARKTAKTVLDNARDVSNPSVLVRASGYSLILGLDEYCLYLKQYSVPGTALYMGGVGNDEAARKVQATVIVEASSFPGDPPETLKDFRVRL